MVYALICHRHHIAVTWVKEVYEVGSLGSVSREIDLRIQKWMTYFGYVVPQSLFKLVFRAGTCIINLVVIQHLEISGHVPVESFDVLKVNIPLLLLPSYVLLGPTILIEFSLLCLCQ
jgi:hypothetical protein